MRREYEHGVRREYEHGVRREYEHGVRRDSLTHALRLHILTIMFLPSSRPAKNEFVQGFAKGIQADQCRRPTVRAHSLPHCVYPAMIMICTPEHTLMLGRCPQAGLFTLPARHIKLNIESKTEAAAYHRRAL